MIAFPAFPKRPIQKIYGEGVAFLGYNDALERSDAFLKSVFRKRSGTLKTWRCQIPLFEDEAQTAYPPPQTASRIKDSLEIVLARARQRIVELEEIESQKISDGSAAPADGGRLAPPRDRPELRTVAEHLRERFGLGNDPKMRASFYARLQREVTKHGSKPYAIIRECVAESTRARHPDRWFCKAVRSRLIEFGFLQSE